MTDTNLNGIRKAALDEADGRQKASRWLLIAAASAR